MKKVQKEMRKRTDCIEKVWYSLEGIVLVKANRNNALNESFDAFVDALFEMTKSPQLRREITESTWGFTLKGPDSKFLVFRIAPRLIYEIATR